jgi:hypothetical protein
VKVRAPAQYALLPGSHYDIYGPLRNEAVALAREWFTRYLVQGN